MGEPGTIATETGRRLLWEFAHKQEGEFEGGADIVPFILAIETEAQDAERARTVVLERAISDYIVTVTRAAHRPDHPNHRTPEQVEAAYAALMYALNPVLPVDRVGVEPAPIRRKPVPASAARLMRIEERPANRGTSIVHEVDEVHPNTEACDLCQLVIAGLNWSTVEEDDRVGVEPLDLEQGWALHGYPVVLYQEPEDGSWSVLAPDLPGFVAADMTIGGALHEAEDAMAVWLDTYREDHGGVPTPSDPHSWPRPPHSYRSKYDDPDLRFSGGCVSCGVTADSHARLIESPTEGETDG